jgi:hypothetical protein
MFVNGKKQGLHETWFDNEKPHSVITYVDGL